MDYLALSFFIAYLIGSIPFGLVLTKLTGHGDIRKIGSGNIGATNVLRTGNKSLALATLVLDGAKGAVAVWLIYTFLLPSDYCESVSCADIESCHCMYGEDKLINIYVAAFAAIIGHCFPAWLKFKGGKGVATTLGTLLAVIPYVGLGACLVWLIGAAMTRISSASALAATLSTPVLAFYFYQLEAAILCSLITVLVWAKHHANIKRLLKGEEPKIGGTKKA